MSNDMKHLRSVISWVFDAVAILCVVWASWYAFRQHEKAEVFAQRSQLMRDLIATTDHGFVVLNPEGQIVEWGPGMEKIFGWTRAEVIGATPDFLMPAEYREPHKLALLKTDAERVFTPHTVAVSCWAFRKDGELIPINIVAASVRNHRGWYHLGLFTSEKGLKVIEAPRPKDVTRPPPPKPMPTEPSNFQPSKTVLEGLQP
jgi:PAS domain S-box-containing protein